MDRNFEYIAVYVVKHHNGCKPVAEVKYADGTIHRAEAFTRADPGFKTRERALEHAQTTFVHRILLPL